MIQLAKHSIGMRVTVEQIKAMLGSICPVCATSRAVVRIPREPARRQATELGQLLHADAWGPYPIEGYDKTKRYIFVTDDATRRTWAKRLARQGDSYEALIAIAKQIQRQYDVKIRSCRVDNEFFKGAFKDWCDSKAIWIEPTVPYAHY